MKKIFRIIIWAVAGIIGLLMAIIVLLLIYSPGKSRPFRDEEGKKLPRSLAVIQTLNVNGVQQKMIIRSADTLHPVILYLHGGPGSPEAPFIRHFGSGLEEQFTMCYWDQRGAGMSYSGDIPPESMTMDQFIEDAVLVSRYLTTRFGKEKIFLMGHSWGSMLGTVTAQRYPQLFYALFTIGQVAQQLRAEQISYDFVLSTARSRGDKKAVAELEKIGRPPYPEGDDGIKRMITERKYVTRYGGSVHNGNFYREASKALFFFPEYTIADKISYFKGMGYSLQHLWPEVIQSNFFEQVPSQQIPVFIFQGKYDYQTSWEVAREYFDILRAPEKQFFTFEHSAHSPNFEETAKFDSLVTGLIEGMEGSGKIPRGM